MARQGGACIKEAELLFYHGFDNYMTHAYPEDELRPLTCGPLTRQQKAGDSSFLDVLGNYSLTLVDSLSTLAILSSLEENEEDHGQKAWKYFQKGVRDIVSLYGDGSGGPNGVGTRSKGFNIDSKVQVFETIIRGVGGLLSAHLFAVGDLPIRGYKPDPHEAAYAKQWIKTGSEGQRGIQWENQFIYDGQLLRLAVDLAHRVLPAFYTPTALPYPRVNLRHGVPFYVNSPFNGKLRRHLTQQQKARFAEEETAETCAAGAGSLVLEFTVLSRLTGDGRFEEMAKRAFWAVWSRRSVIDLVGSGIDAESGQWLNPFTGVGAGIDSFFEYAFKSHVLLSRGSPPPLDSSDDFAAYDSYFPPLRGEQHSPESFLQVYNTAISAIKRHLYRGASYQYPHYVQGDISTGATRAFWMDSLSAYFPGLLTLAGDVEAGAEAHILNTAIWNRFSGIPERWNIATGDAEKGMAFWGGRPEFVESTYYLYRATGDPWYQHVGEMVLRDIKRRCWARCGWAGLLDVRTGELGDRMESFVLGETAKYLYLLYTPDHPLNHLDGPFVFSTEAHPLVIPDDNNAHAKATSTAQSDSDSAEVLKSVRTLNTCPAATPRPFGLSSVPSRPDYYHAASLVRLDHMPSRAGIDAPLVEYAIDHPSITYHDLVSPSNYTFYPWTLPPHLVSHNATCAPMSLRPTLDLSFPPLTGAFISSTTMERVQGGILAKSLSGLRLGMIQDVPLNFPGLKEAPLGYRIQVINNIPLGKDEKVYVSREATSLLNPSDPNFLRVADAEIADLVIDLSPSWVDPSLYPDFAVVTRNLDMIDKEVVIPDTFEDSLDQGSVKVAFSSLINQVASLLRDETDMIDADDSRDSVVRISIPAMTAAGKGAAPLPNVEDATIRPTYAKSMSKPLAVDPLSWSSIYVTDQLCDHRLPSSVPRDYQVLVIKRGGCSFSEKVKNIPASHPSPSSLKLVVVVSYTDGNEVSHDQSDQPTAYSTFVPPDSSSDENVLVRPLLDKVQTVIGGIPRPRPVSVVLVGGGDSTYAYFQHAIGIGIRRRYEVHSQGVPIINLFLS
ncbi:alpha mannosidase-like protein [Ascosphaera aggregata]|nr:alpha mannosidase-like protein [Ascosphaera aggregata]